MLVAADFEVVDVVDVNVVDFLDDVVDDAVYFISLVKRYLIYVCVEIDEFVYIYYIYSLTLIGKYCQTNAITAYLET
jgi:hypothetical protein